MNDALEPNADPTADSAASPGANGNALCPVIGIGASAGGLEALSALLAGLPGDTGMAFVVIQHLDPHHESKLGGILAKCTVMTVLDATDGVEILPDHVYVIPPNTAITVEGAALRLVERDPSRVPHLPIDQFFRSLATERTSGAIGILLSGSGTDGTLGMEMIKAEGGITFAQDSESAKFASMPESAARSGCVDRVLPPAEIARELGRISQYPYVAPGDTPEDTPGDEKVSLEFNVLYEQVLRLLQTETGVDFRHYRDTTIRRRIQRRMVVNTKIDLADYLAQLHQDKIELEALFQDLLINVTSFFRDPEVFEALKEKTFPQILKEKKPGSMIRIWVPGCSTGQEAYSLAMALLEFLDSHALRPTIQIFATDLSDTRSLQKAREGLYPQNIEAEVSPQRLRRFFTKQDAHYRINKSIRDMCVFARQNVAADPPFSRVDLVSCRNLLIYLSPMLQKRVIPTFHYALNPDGFLLLGASETIGAFGDLFVAVDHPHRIYARKPVATRLHRVVDTVTLPAEAGRPHSAAVLRAAPLDWQREADRFVLGHYAPVGVVVNRDFDVLQFRGHTGDYLTPAPGEANLNVLKMAREGLFLELRSALVQCSEDNGEVRRESVRVKTEAGVNEVDLHVSALRLPGGSERCFLVMFENPRSAQQKAKEARVRSAGKPVANYRGRFRRWLLGAEAATGTPSPDDGGVANLRQELASTREYLQSIIEQQDAAHEELKSANEEVLSSNEELQSTNEELETAKEELQSVNEELTTINEQLQHRNLELSHLNDDFSNLLGSANVAMIALGVDLRIRRYSPAAGKLLNLLPMDIGRAYSDLRTAIEIPDLPDLMSKVIDTVVPIQREVTTPEGAAYQMLIHPYRTVDNRLDGAVIVLQNIDEFRVRGARMRRRVEMFNLSQDAIFTRDAVNGKVTFWNRGAQAIYGWTEQEVLGSSVNLLLANSDGGNAAATLHETGRWQGMLKHVRRDGATIDVESHQVWVDQDEDGIAAILEINRDITERKKMESDIQVYAHSVAEGQRLKDEFLAVLAHELRNPLAPLRHGLQTLQLQAGQAPSAAMLDMLERQLRHMTRLVDDLLDVPRISHGRIELRKQKLDLVLALSEVAQSIQSDIDNAGQQLALDLPAAPMMVEADAVRLTQIVENVLTNAIKYSDRGARISLSARPEAGEAVIKVKDTGIGISSEMLPHVWELFAQADRTMERTRGGLGIGLALVKHLTELHGGTVEARSDGLRRGSEFVVRLPLLAGDGEVPAPRPASPAESAARPPSVPRRILIVDDNTDAADSLQAVLKLKQHETRIAYGGLAALEAAAEFHPEIVLLDIGLPGLNGYEVARRMRSNGNKAKIIAVSGYGSDETRNQTAEAGFNAHLVKPIDIDHLFELIAGLDS